MIRFWQVIPGWLEIFFCFFQFNPLTIRLIGNYTSPFFYGIITISWPKLWVSLIVLSFFFIIFLTYFFSILLFNIGLIYFGLFFMRLSRPHNLSYGFGWLTRKVFSCSFFNWFFFQFHPLTLGWLRIELHNLFQFFFYPVIPVSLIRFDMLT